MSTWPKVLHIVYDLMRGGTEGQCARVAMACRKHGARHCVAVFSRSGYFLPAVEDVCGSVYEIGIRDFFSMATIREIRRLSDYIRSGGFDLVHTWDMDAGMFGSLAARLAGVPYITSRRNLAAVMPAYKKRLLKMADRGAAAVVVNAKAVANHFILQGLDSSKARLIPNMLDLEEFDRMAAQDVSLPVGRIIGMVCRLEPEKSVQTLIEAVPRIRKNFDDLQFVIVGEGSERQRLQKLSSDMNVAHAVHFMGERTDVPSLIRHFEVGVLTSSRNEGMSNSVLEYMAAGVPVVATDCGGSAELLGRGEAGLVVPVGDAAALAAALSRLLNHPDEARAMGICGRQRIVSGHAVETVCMQFLNLYSGVLESCDVGHE